ncbi:putative selenate ABC transporter substrate-binding protein [Limimaricola sp. G21655-S1]|uniref:putative selenate ABC transporter substrate-binding protein n=1 Tax=Limimaricola sp. G21655-S1 TaxID=3014768 RepID=UPI0022AF0236|nr:putative selenate ABC transporter substrate-binding protein [Limimaricola sp. G21655-S1]MCZ4262477.1 putative selenate ABC transporter substrate-binding protein [Limimaricola sp. G21655-S1]
MPLTTTRRAFAAAIAILAALPAAAQDVPTLYFSAIPDNDETKLQERFGKVADYLEATLGVPVEYVPVKDYAASVTAFRNDQIQLAWFGGLSGVQARRLVPGSHAIAQGAEDQSFVTYFIANTGTPLTEPEDGSFPEGLEGLSFTFGSQGSTSGRLMPEFHLRRITGEDPRDFFSDVGFSGDHGQTLRLVASGAYDVGALNYTVYEQAVAEGAPEVETTKVIWRTPPYPDYNWTIRGDVDERWDDGFAERVQEAIIAIDDPALLESFPRTGFIAAEDALYDAIEDTAQQLDLID